MHIYIFTIHIYNLANHIYNLIEYSDNYSDKSGSLWQFKRDEPPADNADMGVDESQSFKYKAVPVGKKAYAVNNTNSSVKNTKIVVPLKCLSNFWRSLEMPLINCKIHLELNWIGECILSSARDSAKIKITDAKLHVPIVTISTKDNVNLTKQLSDGFKRSAYWNNHQTIPVKVIENETNICELLSASFQGVKRLFFLAYDATDDNKAGIKDNKKYGRNVYDQPVNDLIKQYDELRKVSTGQDDDYTTGCLLDYAYFKDKYRLIAVDLSKQKDLDADPRAIQKILLQEKAIHYSIDYTLFLKNQKKQS